MPMDRVALLQALERDPSGASIGLTERALPPGRIVGVSGAGPLYWVSEGAPGAADVAAARAGFAVTGLWPLLVDVGGSTTVVEGGAHVGHERVFHWLGEGRPSNPADIDPERWLAEQWQELIAENEANDCFEPEERVSGLAPARTSWPGLAAADAPTSGSAADADACADAMTQVLLGNDWLEQPRMALIPAASGSDALIAARCTLAEIWDVAGHAAVFRSWEQRFGARVIALRSDTLFASVAAVPVQQSSAAHIACEHFAFAPDNVLQNSDSFPEYVADLVDSKLWSFWWD